MTSTAAIVGNWNRSKWKFGPGINAPGPMNPAGNNPDGGTGGPIGLMVELYLGVLGWTDISPYVYYRSGIGVTITRGRADETSQVQPQTAAMVLNNRDGRFSPRNPNNPWFGLLGRNVPLRVSRLNNGIRRYRFYGEVPTWPTTSDISGKDVTVSITASGMLRRLRQGTQTLRSPLSRFYTIAAFSLQFPFSAPAPPVAYWPCEDAQSATQIASGLSGGTPMTVSVAPAFAQNTDFPGSAALPVLIAGSIWTGAIPVVATTVSSLEFLLSVPATGEIDGTVLARLNTTGTVARMDLVYNTASLGTLTVIGYSGTGTQIFAGTGATGISGAVMMVQMQLKPNATPSFVDWELVALNLGNNVIAFEPGTVSGTLGKGTSVTINANGKGAASSIGHIAYQVTQDTSFGATLGTAVTAWLGESPIDRFSRLCAEQNVQAVAVFGQASSTEPPDPTAMGYQTIDTFGTLLQQCPDTHFTPMWEARDQLALMFRSKGTMYNQSAVLTLDMSLNQLSGPLVPVDDDTYTRNDITVTRTGGSSYQAVQTTGPLSIQPFPAGVGDYSTNYDLSIGYDTQLPDQAGLRLHFGTVDEPRYPTIPINLQHSAFTSSVGLLNAALTIDIGDRLDVINPPGPEYPPDPVSQIVQGYTEVMGIFEHSITFNCSPQSPWRVGYLDDAVYGHADTDGSTLAQDYPLGTETSLLVKTTNPASCLWTTNPADFPFDIAVGGERMTVTNITGASSPQTFTVTRSVNAVVKAQTSGTDVRLWQPLILSVGTS